MDFTPDYSSFVFKPHPNLRNALISKGIMNSIDEYEEYLDRFRRLPNASVQEEGDYLALFDTSDALINDSISFICEYMYTGKPMLFLRRAEQRFTPLGEEIIRTQYDADGKDYEMIDRFVSDVVINNNDCKKQARKDLYSLRLDYVGMNGMNAAEHVYRDILNGITAD